MKSVNSFFPALIFLIPLSVFSQDSCKSSIDLGADLMSRYVWRGTDYGRSPSIEPWMEYEAGNFTIGIWGALTTNGSIMQEYDVYASYKIKSLFSLTITDYFNTFDTNSNDNYFDFKNKSTGRTDEIMLDFLGTEKVPLNLKVGTMIFGNDKKDTLRTKNCYSTYLEANYTLTHREVEYKLFIGATPFRGLYASKAAVVNVGISFSKELKVSENWKLPLQCSFITNPDKQNVHLVFGISL